MRVAHSPCDLKIGLGQAANRVVTCHHGRVTLQVEAGDLYGLVPEEFTASRNARAKELRAAGDRGLADQVRKLRRPRTAAWVLNMLVRRLPNEIDELLALGAEIRAAQAGVDRDDLRDLDRRRRELTGALTKRARAIAGDFGHEVKDELASELEGTLRTAMADPAGGAALRTGLLVDSFASLGFEPVRPDRVLAVPDAVSVPAPEPPAPPEPRPHLSVVRERSPAPRKVPAKAPRKRPDPDALVRRRAEVAAQEARAAADDADRALQRATQSHADAVRRRETLEAERVAVQDRLRALEGELVGAHHVEGKARREQDRAEQKRTSAQRTAERAARRAAHTADDRS